MRNRRGFQLFAFRAPLLIQRLQGIVAGIAVDAITAAPGGRKEQPAPRTVTVLQEDPRLQRSDHPPLRHPKQLQFPRASAEAVHEDLDAGAEAG